MILDLIFKTLSMILCKILILTIILIQCVRDKYISPKDSAMNQWTKYFVYTLFIISLLSVYAKFLILFKKKINDEDKLENGREWHINNENNITHFFKWFLLSLITKEGTKYKAHWCITHTTIFIYFCLGGWGRRWRNVNSICDQFSSFKCD